MPSAFVLVNNYYRDIKDIFDKSKELPELFAESAFYDELTKEFFITRGYLPKNGEDLSKSKDYSKLPDKEWNALRELCIYKLRTELSNDKDPDK
jgi:hypothetical protein